jgi:DNA polymerase type B, organellar and viral
LSKFDLLELPPKEAFHSNLNETDITDADYASAQLAWRTFNCQTFKDYHDHYMMSDVLLLADVFENFRDISLNNFGLDPAHYYTLPGLAWDSALKQTGAKLSLISDIDMHLFIENNIRGGISMISERYAKANNKYLIDEPFDETKPTSFIQYLDMNGLYSTVMSRFKLGVSDFKFWTADQLKDGLDLTQIDEDSETGYILEVDIEYPESLHELHSMYPLAAEKLTVTDDMLSPYALSFKDRPRPTEKLVPNLRNKSHYVVHYMNLKLYQQLGLRVTATHRVLQFRQEAWLRPYVDHCMNMRKQAQSSFEKDFW